VTSQGDEREPSTQQDDDDGVTAEAEKTDKKEAVTNRIIRQLIDQIAQLQRASDAEQFVISLLSGSYRTKIQTLYFFMTATWY